MRPDDVVPKPVRVIVRAEASVNDIDVFMLTQFLFDLRPFEQYVLSFAPALLVFGKAHAMHQQFCMYFLDRFDFHAAIFPGVKALVEELSRTVPLAVASGALRQEIETILQTAGLLNYFRAIVSAEDVQQGKPEPEIFINALAALNAARGDAAAIAPTECVVIEDSKEGVRGARRAGMFRMAQAPAKRLNGPQESIIR